MSRLDGKEQDFGLYDGTVIDIDDPLNLRRVRAELPGMGPTVWAFPRTQGGGGAQQGGHVLPAVGSTVLVQFLHGDRRRPVYEGGWWGTGEAPRELLAAGGDATKVQAFEWPMGTDGMSLRVTLDGRAGQRKWLLAAVERVGSDETVIASVELDLEQMVLDLYGLAGVQVRSLGFIDVKGLAARILKRRVDRNTKPI